MTESLNSAVTESDYWRLRAFLREVYLRNGRREHSGMWAIWITGAGTWWRTAVFAPRSSRALCSGKMAAKSWQPLPTRAAVRSGCT